MSATQTNKKVDGRKLRSERSRQAIIDAAIELIKEGVLVPTAQQIVARAGVGIRSFFRHFDDMEALVDAVDNETSPFYRGFFVGQDRSGSLEERILHAAQTHATAYESIRHIVLATLAQTWRYEKLRLRYARHQKNLRAELDNWLPELVEAPPSVREAVDAVASYEMWHRLREIQGLSCESSLEVVVGMMKCLMIKA